MEGIGMVDSFVWGGGFVLIWKFLGNFKIWNSSNFDAEMEKWGIILKGNSERKGDEPEI